MKRIRAASPRASVTSLTLLNGTRIEGAFGSRSTKTTSSSGTAGEKRLKPSDLLTADYFIQTFNDKSKFFIRCICDFPADAFYRKSANLADFDPGFFWKIYFV